MNMYWIVGGCGFTLLLIGWLIALKRGGKLSAGWLFSILFFNIVATPAFALSHPKKGRRPFMFFAAGWLCFLFLFPVHHFEQEKKIRALTATIAAQPGKAKAHYELATILKNKSGRRKEALDHFSKAWKYDPDYFHAWSLAEALNRAGRYAESAVMSEKALALNRGDKDYDTYKTGARYHQAGKTKQARRFFEQACRLGYKTACERMAHPNKRPVTQANRLTRYATFFFLAILLILSVWKQRFRRLEYVAPFAAILFLAMLGFSFLTNSQEWDRGEADQFKGRLLQLSWMSMWLLTVDRLFKGPTRSDIVLGVSRLGTWVAAGWPITLLPAACLAYFQIISSEVMMIFALPIFLVVFLPLLAIGHSPTRALIYISSLGIFFAGAALSISSPTSRTDEVMGYVALLHTGTLVGLCIHDIFSARDRRAVLLT